MPRRILWPIVVAVVALILATTLGLLYPLAKTQFRQGAEPAPQFKHGQPLPSLSPESFALSPEDVRPLTPEEARKANAAMAPSKLPIQPAKPFIAPVADVESYGRALDCMTAAVYYEAGSETPQGQAAVAQVVLNRMRHPAYPKTVCAVVFQGAERTTGCQFTFTCDGSLTRTPSVLGWTRARAVAGAALNGGVATGVGMATHYHADFVVPYWAPRLVKIGQIGVHIFYRWPGAWGLSSAFSGRYALIEPVESRIAALSSFAPRAADLESAFVLPDLPPLDPVAPLPAAAPRIVLQTSAEPIGIDISPAAPQVRAAAVTPRAPQALADPLSATPATPSRSRRIPAPQN